MVADLGRTMSRRRLGNHLSAAIAHGPDRAAGMKAGEGMAGVRERIESKLQAGLSPEELAVIDESNQHHGHAAWRESGETHFRVSVCSTIFAGKSRIERQRLIYGILSEELAGPVHALAISARAPGEPSPESSGQSAVKS